jgi:hypothetical protein
VRVAAAAPRITSSNQLFSLPYPILSSPLTVTRPHTCTCMLSLWPPLCCHQAVQSCDFCSACFFFHSPCTVLFTTPRSFAPKKKLGISGFVSFLRETDPFGKNISCQVRPLRNPTLMQAGCATPKTLPVQYSTRQGLHRFLQLQQISKSSHTLIHALVRSFTFSDNHIIGLSSLDRLRTSIDLPIEKRGGVVPASAPGFVTPGSLNYRSAVCLLGSGLIAMSPILSVAPQLRRSISKFEIRHMFLTSRRRARDLHR